MQLNIFLIISTLLIVKPTVNALFLNKFGIEGLPLAYILVAVFAGFVSVGYSRLVIERSLKKAMLLTLRTSILLLLAFGVLLRLNYLEGWVLYFFYIWVAIFAVLTTSQFWILGNIVFNSREAKRLFGFVGAGAIAGGIFGGYLTSALAPLIGTENLLFIGAFFLLISAPITSHIWKKFVSQSQSKYQQKKRVKSVADHPFNLVKSSKHLTYLAIIIGVGALVGKLVDYQFSAAASASIEDPDSLASFFGFWYSTLNILSLLVQLFITARVVGVYGVGSSLFVLPGGVFIGAMAFLVFPELWAAIVIKMFDGTLKQSVNKSAVELLSLPIPLHIKSQTKTFIDVFIDSLATGIGGMLLFFFTTGFDMPVRFVSLLILVCIVLWIITGLKIRREYFRLFNVKLKEANKDKPAKEQFDFGNKSVFEGIQKVIKTGTEGQIIYMLKKVRELEERRLYPDVVTLLKHPSAEVIAEALQTLYFYKDQNAIEAVKPLTRHTDDQVRIEAFEYLIEHSPTDLNKLIEQFLNDPDPEVKGAALVSLATETRDNPELRNLFNLGERIQAEIDRLNNLHEDAETIKLMSLLLQAAGKSNISFFHGFIQSKINATNEAIANQAITAAGASLNRIFVDDILQKLTADSHTKTAQKALSNYGPSIIDDIEDKLEGNGLTEDTLAETPFVVGLIDSQKSVDFLFQLLDHQSIAIRINALRALNSLRINYPHHNFHKSKVLDKIVEEARIYQDTLVALYAQKSIAETAETKNEQVVTARNSLISLLERRLDGNIERIFRLLGLRYPPTDILGAWDGIQSNKPDLRENAVEFMENVLEPNIKQMIIPIIETALLEHVTEDAVKSLDKKVPSEFECIEMLMAGRDVKVKQAVLFLISQLKDGRYRKLVVTQTRSTDSRIRDFAEKALGAIRE
ncbi:MAG: HEAT repeat domain-containing protein [Cyclobacteriaceae bacterium]